MKYFIIENNVQAGPYSIYELKDKNISSATLVWAEGLADWTPAWQVKELQEFLFDTNSSATPPPYVPPVQPQDNASQGDIAGEDRKKSHHSGRWATISIFVFLLAILTVTCPKREDHIKAIAGKTVSAVNKNMSDSADPFEEGLRLFSNAFLNKFVNTAVDNVLQFHNRIIYSTASVEWKGETHTVSIGLLGHVFTVGQDELDEAIKNNTSFETKKEQHITTAPSDDSDFEDNNAPYDDEDSTDAEQSGENHVGKKIITDVGEAVKQGIKENTDSTTGKGINKIADDVIDFLKDLL